MSDVANPAVFADRRTWSPDVRRPLPLVDYLRVRRATILAVAALSLVAAEVVTAVLLLQPRQFVANAVVTIPAGGTTPYDVGQTVARYRRATTSDAALRSAARATGVSIGSLKDGVSVSRSGTSRYVNVSYRSRHRSEVTRVSKAVAVAGLEQMFSRALSAADKSLAQAQTKLDVLQRQIDAFNSAHGLAVAPTKLLAQKSTNLETLQAQGASAQAIAFAQQEIAALRPLADEFRPLADQQKPLQASVNQHAAKRSDISANLDAARAPSTVQVGPPHDTTSTGVFIIDGTLTFVLFFPLLYALATLGPRLTRMVRR